MNLQTRLQQAARLYQQGDWQSALEETERLLVKRPKLGDALHLRGLVLDRLGRRQEAIASLRRAARLLPDKADLHLHLGITLVENGTPLEALPHLERATRLNPRQPEPWHHLGTARLQSGDKDAARAALEQALELRPDHLPSLNNLALACFGKDDAQAERLLRRAIEQAPGHAPSWANLGELLSAQGRHDEARPLLERALELDPHSARPQFHLGLIATREKDWETALVHLEAAHQLAPDDEEIQFHFALAQVHLGQCQQAQALVFGYLERHPDQADAWSLLGLWHQAQSQWPEAENAYREALEIEPTTSDARNNLGLSLYQQSRYPEAKTEYLRALEQDPHHPLAHHNLALLLLLKEQFEAGFVHYRHRQSRKDNDSPFAEAPLPESLAGKHILLIGDQGLGDELFFLRYLPQLQARGPARITLQASEKLIPLLQRHLPKMEIVEKSAPRPAADFSYSMGDLPYLLGATEPAPPLPLQPRTDHVALLREQLTHLGPPPYLGITWRAGPRTPLSTGHLDKHVPLDTLAEAIAPWPGTLLALQRHPEADELVRLGERLGRPVFDLTTLNEDLDVMLAALALLDDYVAVSNTNVHLRAGLGRPSRVLIPLPSEWRWGLRQHSPWFPDHPLYRQDKENGWKTALERLKNDLEHSSR